MQILGEGVVIHIFILSSTNGIVLLRRFARDNWLPVQRMLSVWQSFSVSTFECIILDRD
jgi:hypothetical protein